MYSGPGAGFSGNGRMIAISEKWIPANDYGVKSIKI